MPKYNLLEEEIKWCKAHRNPKEKKYQDGFISGLEHALWLMKSRPTPRAADLCPRSEFGGNHDWHKSRNNEICINCGISR